MLSGLLAGMVQSVCTYHNYHHHHRRRCYCCFDALMFELVLIPWQLHVVRYTETEPRTLHDH
jgi:hypothetical protein